MVEKVFSGRVLARRLVRVSVLLSALWGGFAGADEAQLLAAIDARAEAVKAVSQQIFEFRELGQQEFKSSQLLMDELRKLGFSVQGDLKVPEDLVKGGIAKTAFRAELKGKGPGPTVTAAYPDASFAALRFGASGTLDVPLTPDAPAIDNWANTLAVEATSVSAGSSLDAPIDQLLLTAKSIREAHPDDAIVLYLITDGEQTSNVTRRTFSSLRQYLNDGFTVGVGSTEGGKIPVIADGVSAGDSNTTDHWVVDPDTGEPGISKMDEKNLKDIADEISGTYVAVNASQTLADSVSAKSSKQWRMTTTVKERTRTTPVVWPLAIALAILLAMEVGAWIATSRRLL